MAPFNREPGSHKLPYGLPLGIALPEEFSYMSLGVDHNMARDGRAVTVPDGLYYAVTAEDAPVAFHSFAVVLECASRPLPDLFGALPELTNVLVLQVRDPDNDIIGDFPAERPIQANWDWYRLGPEYVTYDTYPLAQPGAGSVSVLIATQPAEDAVALERGWSIGFLIQDDLSDLADFSAVAFGRRLEPRS